MERKEGNTAILERPREEASPVIKRESKKMKFLKAFGKFLMYGGWILIAILALAITIAVSILTK